MANPFDQAFRDLQADNAQQGGGDNPFDAAFAGLGPQAPADLGPRTAGTIAADTWAQFGAGANRMASGMSRLAGAATQPLPENLGLADRARFAASTAGGALMDAFAGVMGLAEQASPFNRAAAEMGMGFSARAGAAADELGLRAAEIEAREAEAAQASGGRTLQQRREANVFNQLAEALSGYQAGYEEQLSPQAKARAQERAGAIESGPMELLQFLLTNPSHAIEVGVESLPTIVPGAALARGARALGAGQTAAQRLGEAGTVSTMTGASAGNVYQGVMELPDDQLQQLPGYADLASELGPEGAREALARQGMQAAIAFGAPVDAATVGLASRLGLNVVEQAAAGRGRLGSTALGALSGAGREAAGEFPQGVGQQIAENVGQAAAGQRDRSNLTEGALEAGILEAFASLGPGAAFGAGSATSGEQARRARDTQDDAEVDAVLREQVAQLERDAQRMPPTRRTQMADAISQALAGESAPLQGSAESQADESDSLQQRNDDETAGSPSALSDVAEQVDARLAELEDQAAANERTPEQMRALRAERDQLRDLLREVEASEGVIPADPAGRMSSEERAAATDRMAEITAELEAAGAASAFRREADRIRERLDRTDTDGEFLAAAKSLGFRPRQAAPRAPAPAPQRAEAPQPAAPTSSPAAAAFAGETEGAGTGSREDLISRWRAARTPRERADAAAALAAFNQQETRDGQAEAEEGAVPQGRQAQPDTGAEQPGPVSSRGQADSAPPAPGRARVTGDDRARRTAIGREIERVVSGLEDAPGVQFHVDTSTIPGEIASRAEAAGGIDSGVEAFYDPATDTIHAVIGNITGGRRRGGWVAEHEVGHVLLRSYAMRGDNDLRTIVERAAQNDAVAQVMRSMADQRPETDSLLQEEALVELMTATRTGNYGEIESRYGVTVPQAMRDDLVGAMRRVLQRIRTWLANHGITSAPTMSDAEVFDIMQRAFAEGRVAERANRGGTRAGRRRRAGGDDVVAQRAFHGTPQREIDAFSLNRIGTGEGNQAFGWGLYFASRRDVADAYRGALTGVNRRPGGRLADESIQRRGSRAEAIRELTALRDRAATPARRTEYQQAIDFIRSGVNRGQTYAVDVPENDVLLDYDAPLSQQPQAVQDAVRALEADGSIAPGTLDADPSGAVIYSALGEPQEASRLLREAGIPGLRYLDGGSRAAGDGTHNFVIWDEALIGAPEPLVASRRDPQTDTPEFRRWFGDSKVVDENGEPLVVYHGTPDGRFMQHDAVFKGLRERHGMGDGDGAFWFARDEATARTYADERRAFDYQNAESAVVPAYLRMENPLIVDGLGREWREAQRRGRTSDVIAEARAGGHDGVIIRNVRDDYTGFGRGSARIATDTYVVFDSRQIKSATGNRGTFDPADPSIVASRRDPATESQEFRRWSNDAPIVTSDGAQDYPFKSGEKVVVQAFHGTRRPDRVGSRFRRSRATSGPMAFFTSSPEIASNYATGKQDTSIDTDEFPFESWFKFKPRGSRSRVDIVSAWNYLSREQKNRIAEMAPQVALDDNSENIVVIEGNIRGIGNYDYELQQTTRRYGQQGNPIKALVEGWLNGGPLFGDEQRFMEVLEAVGFPVESVEFDSPYAEFPAVYPAYVVMNSPLVTSDVPAEVSEALNRAARRSRARPAREYGADSWDKRTKTIREWVGEFNSDDQAMAWTSIPDDVTKVFRDLGYDGIIDDGGKAGGQRHKVYIPFNENQVKSKFNRGGFDPYSNNIMASRRTPSEANMERAQLLSRLDAEGYAAGPVVPMPTPGRFAPLDDRIDSMRIKLQDKMLAVRRAQERAARGAPRQPGITTATLDDAMNAYRLENLMHGRVQDRLRGLDAELLTPLMKQLRRTGRSVAQLEDYLLARHAEERNARIASINPAMQDAGAGITTQMARDILAGREAGPYSGKRLGADDIAILESAAKKVDRMVATTRETLEEAGLISPELANALRATYSNYVPLRGYKGQEDEVTSGRGSGTGGGVTPGRANVRRAGGRGDMNLAQDILGEVVGDMQRAVIQAEKSRVAQSFLRFAMANPMPDLFTIEPVDLEWKFSESTGEAYLGVVNRAEDMGTSLVVPHNGTMVRIRFEDQRLADAMLNLNLADMSWFVQNIGAINRWRSAVLTRWNPSFFFVNLLRDAQFGMAGIAAERGIATAAQAAANYAPAFAALVRDNYSRSGDSSVPDAQKTMADWAREYAEAGAKTGIVLSEEVTDLQRRLSESATKIMQLAAEGKPLRAARQSLIRYGGPIIETIENFNDASENAIRLSAYVAMRKQGTSIEQAAEYAKNLTINFNRKGESGSTLNAIYLFYNAAMQGAHAVFRVMRKPGVQAFLGGMAGLQYLAALAMMGDDDDDGITDWDTVPDYVKRTSLVIPLGHFTGDSQDYFALPMPYGFNVVPYAGGRLAQYAHSGERPTDSSIAADLIAVTTESFSPIPLQDGYRSLFGDTIGFFMGMAMNEDDMGRPIARENPYAQYDVPKALEGNVTTPRAYHVASQILAKLGGGDLERREAPVGYLDIAPEQIKEMVEFMAGGLGNIANKSARFYEQMSAGNLENAMDVIDATPIVSRFIGKGKAHRAVADRYYGEMGELARGLDRLRDRVASDPDNAEQALEDLRREEPALEGIEFDRFRANTRSGGRRGEIRTSPDGSPRFQPMPGSAFESRREAEREVTDINRSIRRLRTPGMTNADVVDMLGQMPPRADLPASERPVLEALGLPQDFDAEAQAPNRVRQRAIRMLQDQRMRSQQDFLRDLESDRRRARE